MKVVVKISIFLVLLGILTFALQYISSDENSIDLTKKSTSNWELVSDNPVFNLK